MMIQKLGLARKAAHAARGALLLAVLGSAAAAEAQRACQVQRLQGVTMATALLNDPEYGATEIPEGPQEARRRAVLARQEIRIAPRVTYLDAPVVLTDEEGRDLTGGIPLGRGAPISQWRDADGVRHCAIGWRNGLFGGVAGNGHLRWMCFEDSDEDGAFDTAYRPWTRNLGLSFDRRDFRLAPPVRGLPELPADAAVTTGRGTLSPILVTRTLAVSRIDRRKLTLESRAGFGNGEPIERRDVPLDAPSEVTIAGLTVSVEPVAGGAPRLTARGAFDPSQVGLACNGSHVRMGDTVLGTTFTFPDW